MVCACADSPKISWLQVKAESGKGLLAVRLWHDLTHTVKEKSESLNLIIYLFNIYGFNFCSSKLWIHLNINPTSQSQRTSYRILWLPCRGCRRVLTTPLRHPKDIKRGIFDPIFHGYRTFVAKLRPSPSSSFAGLSWALFPIPPTRESLFLG